MGLGLFGHIAGHPSLEGPRGDLEAKDLFKRIAIVTTRQTKRHPEKFHRKTKTLSENSLKIETPQQSFCKISCVSICLPADWLVN
jgi:hypothetical protein